MQGWFTCLICWICVGSTRSFLRPPQSKYFVLEPPAELIEALDLGLGSPLVCQEFGHMYSFEVYFPDFLRDNPQHLADLPEAADFVVLPHCTTYLYHLYRYRYGYGSTVEDCWQALKLVQENYLLPLIEWAKSQPVYKLSGGHNFLIVYSMDKGRVDYPMAAAATSNWKALSTVGNGSAWLKREQPYLSGPSGYQSEGLLGLSNPCEGSVERKRKFIWHPQDIVLPVPVAFHWAARSNFWDHESRPILMLFSGTPNSCLRRFICDTFRNTSTPDLLVSDVPRPRDQFSDLLYQSRFCLVPDGFSAISARLYEVMAHGCIPVIISEAFHPPFEGLVDFRRFAVFVRPEEVPFVDVLLRQIDESHGPALHQELTKVAPLIDLESLGFWTATLKAIERTGVGCKERDPAVQSR